MLLKPYVKHGVAHFDGLDVRLVQPSLGGFDCLDAPQATSKHDSWVTLTTTICQAWCGLGLKLPLL